MSEFVCDGHPDTKIGPGTPGSDKNSIILGIAMFAIIVITVAVVTFLICKKKSEEKKKKEIRTDENPVYGSYTRDGPVYNVVTDANAYYSS